MFHVRMQKEKPKQHHHPAEQRSQGFIFEEYEEFGMCGVELTGNTKLQGDSQMYRGMSLNLVINSKIFISPENHTKSDRE